MVSQILLLLSYNLHNFTNRSATVSLSIHRLHNVSFESFRDLFSAHKTRRTRIEEGGELTRVGTKKRADDKSESPERFAGTSARSGLRNVPETTGTCGSAISLRKYRVLVIVREIYCFARCRFLSFYPLSATLRYICVVCVRVFV